jgi:hypothetical protein
MTAARDQTGPGTAETIRPAVVELVALGRLPTDEQWDADPLRGDRWAASVGQLYVDGDVTDDEACALLGLLPEDDSDSYGVAWTLVHVIESAPGWPLRDALDHARGPWSDLLRGRAART